MMPCSSPRPSLVSLEGALTLCGQAGSIAVSLEDVFIYISRAKCEGRLLCLSLAG